MTYKHADGVYRCGPNEPLDSTSQNLRTGDLVTALRGLSKIFSLPANPNLELANAFSKLADILQRYRDKPVKLVLDNLVLRPTPLVRTTMVSARKPPVLDTVSYSLEQIEELLRSPDLSKLQLVNIGVARFGMSRSVLMKTKRAHLIDTIRTAISNMRTMDIIGKEAAGQNDKPAT